MKVCVVFGTRPEAIKLAPVILQLKKEKIDVQVVLTSQHKEMLRQVLDIFQLQVDEDLKVMKQNQTLQYVTSEVLKRVYKTLEEIKPHITLVQGDTASTFSSALASYYLRIPLGHVEAGLRTYDKFNPFPEEIMRRLTAPLADYNFAPTRLSVQNLLREGIREETIYLTGNTVVDALLYISQRIKAPQTPELKNLDFSKKIILLTTHRRESFGRDMEEILTGVKDISLSFRDVLIVFPVHKNPNVRKTAFHILRGIKNIILTEPLPYTDLVYIMKNSYLILTDSGGIQEEAPTFGVPVLVLRKKTERPEGIESGVAKLVGAKRERIVEEASLLLSSEQERAKMSKAKNPYGDGKASRRIVEVLTGGKILTPYY